jgi:hypothetical protein
MKPVHNTLGAAVAATTAMTLFSYILSKKKGENFREPALLADYAKRNLGTSKKKSQPLGWATHYVVGLGFAIGYRLLLRATRLRPSPKNGIPFGAAAGVIGIFWWKNLFERHLLPPNTSKKRFFRQLIVAHLIFGLVLSETTQKKADRAAL